MHILCITASSILPLQFILKLKNSEGWNSGIVVQVCIICNYRFGTFAMLLSTFAMLLLVMKTLEHSSKRLSLQWFTTHVNLSILHSLQICRWTKTDKNVPHWKMYVATSLQALSALVHLLIFKLCSILWYTT